MATIIQGTNINLTVWAGGVGPYTTQQVYQNGTGVAPSLGTAIDNGDGTVTFQFDATDTSLLGDFAWTAKDSIGGKFAWYGWDVWNSPIGFLPNDGTIDVRLQSLNLIHPAGVAFQIQSFGVGNQAVTITSDDDGIKIAAANRGVFINSTNSCFSLQTTTNAVSVLATAVGLSMSTGSHCVEMTSTVNGDGVKITSPVSAVNLIGVLCGLSARCSFTSLPVIIRSAIYWGADGLGLRGRSINGDGFNLSGNTAGGRIAAPGANPAVLYNAVEMAKAFADAMLDQVDGVEPNRTVRKCLRLLLSAGAGMSFLLGANRTYRDTNNTKNRIDATTDPLGQRTAVTLDDT